MRLLALLLALVASGAAEAARFEQLVVGHAKGVFSLRAVMVLDAPLAAVRSAMTDYDHLDDLSAAILESRRLRQVAGGTLVYTRSRGCVGWFCREVRKTELVEVRGDTILARAVPEQSNVTMSVTRWTLEAAGAGTRVRWETDVDPAFFVPPLIGPPLMKKALRREGEAMAQGLERAAQRIASGRRR